MNCLFSVVFEDNSVFNGGIDYNETKWKSIPNKKIRSIFYRIPCGDYICLSNYDSYYHFVEACTDLNGENKDKVRLQATYLLAKKGNKVIVYKFDLTENNFSKIDRKELDKNDDFVTKLNQEFWK